MNHRSWWWMDHVFFKDANDHQLSGSFYTCGILSSIILVAPLGVPEHGHFDQEIEETLRSWLFLAI